MPRKSDSARVTRKYDRRIKLSEQDKEAIRGLYYQMGEGIREIARQYEGKCSRRLIQFILFPERADTAKQNFKRWRKENPLDKNKWAGYMRGHREYKVKLDVSGVLKYPFFCRVFYRKTDFKTSRRFVYATLKEAKAIGAKAAKRGCYAKAGELEGHPIAGPYSQEKTLLEYGLQNKGRKYWAERYQLKKNKDK